MGAKECAKKLHGTAVGSFSIISSTATVAHNPKLTETKIIGQLGVQVSNLEAFVQDSRVQDSFKTSIAEITNANLAWVDVPLALKTRRHLGAERRLRFNVAVNYVITIPSNATTTTASNGASITNASPYFTLTTTDAVIKVQKKLNQAVDSQAYTDT